MLQRAESTGTSDYACEPDIVRLVRRWAKYSKLAQILRILIVNRTKRPSYMCSSFHNIENYTKNNTHNNAFLKHHEKDHDAYQEEPQDPTQEQRALPCSS